MLFLLMALVILIVALLAYGVFFTVMVIREQG